MRWRCCSGQQGHQAVLPLDGRHGAALFGSLCPLTLGRPSVADVRPLSTLRPGECYAELADAPLERRRLMAFASNSRARSLWL